MSTNKTDIIFFFLLFPTILSARYEIEICCFSLIARAEPNNVVKIKAIVNNSSSVLKESPKKYLNTTVTDTPIARNATNTIKIKDIALSKYLSIVFIN